MTIADIVTKMIAYAGDDYDESELPLLNNLVESATEEVVNALCRYDVGDNKLTKLRQYALARHGYTILAIAQYHYDKQGKEGVLSFKENTTQATYEEGAKTPKSFFKGIIPLARVV